MERISRIAGLLILIVITVATLCPIEFRPETGHPSMERIAAFMMLGVALGAGFPRRLVYSCAFVVGVAVCLEALQLVDPSRHGRVVDLVVKAVGGIIGVAIPHILTRAYRHASAD